MTNEFRLNDKDNLAINYRLSEDKINYFSKLIEPKPGRKYLKTEHELINEWATFAKSAFVGDNPESHLKCWEGHYEQFGLVILTYAKMCRYRQDWAGKWDVFLDSTFPHDCYDHLFEGPSGTEDRIYYRAWFGLLGHPDFLGQSLIGMEAITRKDKELSLCIAFRDFNMLLAKKH